MTGAPWSKLRMEINVIMVLKCLPGRMQCSWLHVKQFTVCSLITKHLGSLYSRKIQFHDNTPIRMIRTFFSLDHYTVGEFHCVQCGLFPLCMSSTQSGTQLRSHAKQPCQGLDFLVLVQKLILSTSVDAMKCNVNKVPQSWLTLGINR